MTFSSVIDRVKAVIYRDILCRAMFFPILAIALAWGWCYYVVDVVTKQSYRAADAASLSQTLLYMDKGANSTIQKAIDAIQTNPNDSSAKSNLRHVLADLELYLFKHRAETLAALRDVYDTHTTFLLRGIKLIDSQGRVFMQYPQIITANRCTITNGIERCQVTSHFVTSFGWLFTPYPITTQVGPRYLGVGDVVIDISWTDGVCHMIGLCTAGAVKGLINVILYYDSPIVWPSQKTWTYAVIILIVIASIYLFVRTYLRSRQRIAQLEQDNERMHKEKEEIERKARLSALDSVLHDIRGYVLKIDDPACVIRQKVRRVSGIDSEVLATIEAECDALQHVAIQMNDNVEAVRPLLDDDAQSTSYVLIRDDVFSPVEVISHLATVYTPRCKNFGVSFQVELVQPEATEWKVRGDRRILLSCLENLVKNALDAFRKTSPPIPDPVITVRLGGTPRSVCISVVDNGSGVPEETLVDFYQGQRTRRQSGSGRGVGLKYAKEHLLSMGVLLTYNHHTPSGAAFSFEMEGVDNGTA